MNRKYIPKLNAAQQLYADLTGIWWPAGLDDEPTPPVPPTPVYDTYLYFENISGQDGNIIITDTRPSQPNLEYRVNLDGEWTSVGEVDAEYKIYVPITAGDVVYFRGNNSSMGGGSGRGCKFKCDVQHNIGGCLLSILNNNPEQWPSVTTIGNYCFINLFSGDENLVSVENLNIANVNKLEADAMNAMFQNCTSLKNGLDISNIDTVASLSLRRMYGNCTSLESVYSAKVWDIDAYYIWLQSASSSGIVYKPASLTIPNNSDNGVPTGWTTQDYE